LPRSPYRRAWIDVVIADDSTDGRVAASFASRLLHSRRADRRPQRVGATMPASMRRAATSCFVDDDEWVEPEWLGECWRRWPSWGWCVFRPVHPVCRRHRRLDRAGQSLLDWGGAKAGQR
jgi:hypothetical protein